MTLLNAVEGIPLLITHRIDKGGRDHSSIFGLFVQAIIPAGPDGIREQGSYLLNELRALFPHRSILVQV